MVNWRSVLLTFVVWLLATCLSFAGIVAIIALIGYLTDSSPMCGLRGPTAKLMMWILLSSTPLSILVGVYAAWRWHRRHTREEKNA